MPDIGGLLADASAIVAAFGAAAVVSRRSKHAAMESSNAETVAARINSEATSQAKFRDDILSRVTNLERQLDEANRLREVDRIRYQDVVELAARKFEAREAQLTTWGIWDTNPPPRKPPAFVWPPVWAGSSDVKGPTV